MEKQLDNLDILTNHLIYNVGHIDDPGLFDGKMGICIFFCHLAKKTKNNDYQDLAEKLIYEICEDIHLALVPDFGRGVSGIGWGMEYLIQNKLLDIDASDVLNEFDSFISESFISNKTYNETRLDYLIGHGVYYATRIQNPNKGNTERNRETLARIMDQLYKRIHQSDLLIEEGPAWQIPSPIPALLWLCSQLIQYKGYKAKAEKIIQELIDSISGKADWPKLHNHRLQLLWGISEINSHNGLTVDIHEKPSHIDREQIELEIKKNDPTLEGTLGIALLYEQLYESIGDGHYLKEFEHWKNRTLEIIDSIDLMELLKKEAQIPFGIFSRLPGLGLLSGLSGIGLVLLKNDATWP